MVAFRRPIDWFAFSIEPRVRKFAWHTLKTRSIENVSDLRTATSAALIELDRRLTLVREIRDTILSIASLRLDEARKDLVAEAFERFAASQRAGRDIQALRGALELLRKFESQLKEHLDG